MERFNYKLLIIEDDEPSMVYYEQIAERHVKHVYFARNAFDGIELFNKHKPDLILTDINMPEMNGLEMIQRIKLSKPDLRFIIMSAYGQSEFFIKAIELGAKGFLLKPVDRQKLSNLLIDWGKQISMEKEYNKQQEENHKQKQLLIQKSKLESLGKLASGIAHEINQPLGGISMALENIIQKNENKALNTAYLNAKMESISQHIKRINNILEHIRTFSMIQKDDLKTHFNPNECISNALRLTKSEIQNNKISVTLHLTDKPFSIKGNRFRMEQVILSLIGNSIEALNQKAKEKQNYNDKQIKISSSLTADNLILETEDNGTGIEQENVENIFDPFFTTKSPDKGSGLGLSVVYGIIQDMGGTIRAESEKGAYARIIIQLPIAHNKL